MATRSLSLPSLHDLTLCSSRSDYSHTETGAKRHASTSRAAREPYNVRTALVRTLCSCPGRRCACTFICTRRTPVRVIRASTGWEIRRSGASVAPHCVVLTYLLCSPLWNASRSPRALSITRVVVRRTSRQMRARMAGRPCESGARERTAHSSVP